MNDFLTSGNTALFLFAPIFLAVVILIVVALGFRYLAQLMTLLTTKNDTQNEAINKRITEVKEGILILLDRTPRPN